MKKFLLPLLAVALSACTMSAPAYPPMPASGLTGNWQGSASKYWISVQITANLTLQDKPNPGDFTGTLKIASPEFSGTVRGNVGTGEIVATENGGAGTVTCTGKFLETPNSGGLYTGSCTVDGVSGSVTLNRQTK